VSEAHTDEASWPFGIAPTSHAKLLRLFENTPGLARVWVYGSRARGDQRRESDIDLALEWREKAEFARLNLADAIEEMGLIYRTDLTDLSEKLAEDFRARLERDKKLFWEPRRAAAKRVEAHGAIQLKPFQATVLQRLDDYLLELKQQAGKADKLAQALKVAEAEPEPTLLDFPRKAWEALKKESKLPPTFAGQPFSSRFDGAGRPIPNACLKIPTGGGKTLLAAAAVGRVFSAYLGRHAGLVLWIVPNEAIYRQTLKTLSDRDHPYRQMLNVAGAGRVKILEKDSPLTKQDVDSHLCVMLLMLQSAARKDEAQRKLKAFRDRGNVLGFVPREDDYDGHWALLQAVPNLDVYAPFGISAEDARATRGSVIKSSLGNVLRLTRPMVVMDEGHHAYTENALRTLDGFNPSFLLELSATPRLPPAKGEGSGSNILVDVRGTDLDDAEMIKLPIHVDVRGWSDWQSCLAAGVERLDGLQREADALHGETNRALRPIMLVQVERTGKDMRDAGYIHAEDAKAYLMQLGFSERQIAIKTSDKDELKQPENLDLLSPTCEVRAIITKQALQEGWDCPFAYVLCALAAGRDPRAMTQLVGRILRQPQVAKTGRPALDSCYVLCHNAKTGEVVQAIKKSLESEGMGDLAIEVAGGGSSSDGDGPKPAAFRRRPAFKDLRIFLPRVTAQEADGSRRELDYEGDILGRVDWSRLKAEALASEWAPGDVAPLGQTFDAGLDLLLHPEQVVPQDTEQGEARRLDRARLVRGLLDIVPNAWWLWSWVEDTIQRLLAAGFGEAQLASSAASLLERLRLDLTAGRDALAQAAFEDGVAAGRIEFTLRADRQDYELPRSFSLPISGKPQALTRPDGRVAEKSLFEPAIKGLTDTGLEEDFACYLDGKAALSWWHRNVARSQYGLQGWKRHKVYPDFVFARLDGGHGSDRLVVMETKGLHLAGSDDTDYKKALLTRLTQAYRDERFTRAGSLELVGGTGSSETVVCDLIFDADWQGSLEARHFAEKAVS